MAVVLIAFYISIYIYSVHTVPFWIQGASALGGGCIDGEPALMGIALSYLLLYQYGTDRSWQVVGRVLV